MPDIVEDLDEVIAGWEDNRDAARWSPDPQVMDAIEEARNRCLPISFEAPVVNGALTIDVPRYEAQESGPAQTHDEAGYCIHVSEDGRSATITNHLQCAICNAS